MTAAEKKIWVVDAVLLALLLLVFSGTGALERSFIADAERRAAAANANMTVERTRAEQNSAALVTRAAERERAIASMSSAGIVLRTPGPNAKRKGSFYGVAFHEDEIFAESGSPVEDFTAFLSGGGFRVVAADVFAKSPSAKGLDGLVASWHPSAVRALRDDGKKADGFFRSGITGKSDESMAAAGGAFFVSTLFAGEETR